MDASCGDRRHERVEKVSAMQIEVRCTEATPSSFQEGNTKQRLPTCPIPSDADLRLESVLSQFALDTQSTKDLHGIGAQADACAYFHEFARLLEKVGVDSGTSQREQRGQATEPAPDQCNARFSRHVIAPAGP
jgi:hypothetical protein